MKYVFFALIFMALGGLLVHISWLHSWRMYQNGKAEGRGLLPTRQNGGGRSA